MTLIYDYDGANVTLEEAKRIINEIVNESDDTTIENFWMVELSSVVLRENDRKILDRMYDYKNSNDAELLRRYSNLLKFVIRKILKKNWRRLLNNNIVEKYLEYDDVRFNSDIKKVYLENDICQDNLSGICQTKEVIEVIDQPVA